MHNINFYEAWDALDDELLYEAKSAIYNTVQDFIASNNFSGVPANWGTCVDIATTTKQLKPIDNTSDVKKYKITTKTKLSWRCPKCGNTWESSIKYMQNKIQRSGIQLDQIKSICPKCGRYESVNGSNSSIAELTILHAIEHILSTELADKDIQIASQVYFDKKHPIDFVFYKCNEIGERYPFAAAQYDSTKYHSEGAPSAQPKTDREADVSVKNELDNQFIPLLRIREKNCASTPGYTDGHYETRKGVYFYVLHNFTSSGHEIDRDTLNEAVNAILRFVLKQEHSVVDITEDSYNVFKTKARIDLKKCYYKIYQEYVEIKNGSGHSGYKDYDTYTKFADNTPFKDKQNIIFHREYLGNTEEPIEEVCNNQAKYFPNVDSSLILNDKSTVNPDLTDSVATSILRRWGKSIEQHFRDPDSNITYAALYYSYTTPTSDSSIRNKSRIVMEKLDATTISQPIDNTELIGEI